MDRLFFDPEGRLRSGWKAAGFLLLFTVLGILWSMLLKATGLRRLNSGWASVVLVAAASWICTRAEGRPFPDLGLKPSGRWALEFLAGVGLGAGLILATALLVLGCDGFHWERAAASGLSSLSMGAWMFLGVAVNEELMFRGYPFQRLVEGLGLGAAQLLFAALFAFGHWGNPGMVGATKAWASLNIGLAAVLLGLAWARTRSLALPIGLHLGWNWAQGPLLGFGVSGTTDAPGFWRPVFHGRPEWLTGGAFGLEASLPCALVCGFLILGLWRWKGTAPASGGASTASAS